MSANVVSDVSAYIKYGNEKITSSNNLKILGFMFGEKPSIHPHVDYIVQKAKKKLWSLRHVKKAGMQQSDLLNIFNSIIRPTLEYEAPTFHSMLTAEMAEELEYIQRRPSKIIFGWDSHYSELVSAGKIETLANRREKLTLNFAKKALQNERFGGNWFPEKISSGINLRKENKFEKKFARTKRLQNSPLFYMRRQLNKLYS